MAKANGPGIEAKAPRLTHAQNKKQGKAGKNAAPTYQGLNADQNQTINQRNQADNSLSGYANAMLPGLQSQYSQGPDYDQLPQSPWSQGQSLDQMNTDYYNKALDNYHRSNADLYKQQDQDFEQQMSNRGIPQGSDLYNNLKKQTADQRSQAEQNAQDSAYMNAGQNATTWNNIGTQNYQNAYGDMQARYNQPLNTFNSLYGSVSGMPTQNLGYSQQGTLQGQQIASQNKIAQGQLGLGYAQLAKSGSGGGGGGGGSDPYGGFGSQQGLWDAQDARNRANQQWQWANQPKAPSGPSPWASGLGQIGGAVAGSYINSLF